MGWILMTWIMVNGAPRYQYSKPVATEQACEALFQEVSKTKGSEIAGHKCVESGAKRADAGTPDAGVAETAEQCFTRTVAQCGKLKVLDLQVACTKMAHRECKYLPQYGE